MIKLGDHVTSCDYPFWKLFRGVMNPGVAACCVPLGGIPRFVLIHRDQVGFPPAPLQLSCAQSQSWNLSIWPWLVAHDGYVFQFNLNTGFSTNHRQSTPQDCKSQWKLLVPQLPSSLPEARRTQEPRPFWVHQPSPHCCHGAPWRWSPSYKML